MIHFAKFIISIFITITASQAVKASFLDDVAACFLNPCSCGNSDYSEQFMPSSQSIRDIVNNQTYDNSGDSNIYTFPKNLLSANSSNSPNQNCPPYNRYNGRQGCLYQFDAPSDPFLGSYRVYCAEANPGATYTNPSITIRMQACNFLVCFTESTTLNASTGQCVTWPTQYGIPTIRFCARIAVNKYGQAQDSIGQPLYNIDGTPQITYNPDDGYMFHFLDNNGYPRPDPGIQNSSGYTVFLPKICLYEDPSYVEALTGGYMEPYRMSGMDTYDRNIYNQTLQYDPTGANSGNPNPGFLDFFSSNVVQNTKVERTFFFNNNTISTHFTSQMLQGISVTPTPNPSPPSWNSVTGTDWQTSYQTWVQNFVVNKYNSLGCSYLPIGPFPPPFCTTLAVPPATVSIQAICPQELVYDSSLKVNNAAAPGYLVSITDSTRSAPCTKSLVRNNFVYNSVRVSVDNILPICTTATTSTTAPNCMSINYGSYGANYIYDYMNDTIEECANSSPPCLSYIPTGTSVPDGYRVVYGTQSVAKGAYTQLNGYPADITAVCSTANSVYPCVGVYGINIGAYHDVTFDLSSSANVDYTKNYTIASNTTLSDTNSNSFTITPTISYQGGSTSYISATVNGDSVTLDANSICVFFNLGAGATQNAGCVKRALPPQLTASNCSPPPSGSNASCPAAPTFLTPLMLVGVDYSLASGSTFLSGSATQASSSQLSSATYSILTRSVPTDKAYTSIGLVNLSTGLAGTTQTPTPSTTTTPPNLIGYLLTSLATDSNYYMPPFTSANVPVVNLMPTSSNSHGTGSLTLWGKYLGTTNSDGSINSAALPVIASSSTYIANSNAKYLSGVEYYNGLYVRGGLNMTAGAASTPTCHMPIAANPSLNEDVVTYDDTFCVLAKLNYESNLSSGCTTFNNAGITTRCPSDTSGCTANASVSSYASSGATSESTTSFSSIPYSAGGSVATAGTITYYTCAGNPCYKADGLPLGVCQVSTFPMDRVYPAPPSSATSSPAIPVNQYYDTTSAAPNNTECTPIVGSGTNYNPAKCGTRSKTIVESGVTVPIIQPTACPANNDGNASWPAANVGSQSVGSCALGYSAPSGGLQGRNCYIDMNMNVKEDPVSSNTTCTLAQCPSDTAGNANWPSVTYGQVSTPTCQSPYSSPPTGGFPTRRCTLLPDGTYGLPPLTGGQTCYQGNLTLAGKNSNFTVATVNSNANLSVSASSRRQINYPYGCCTSSTGSGVFYVCWSHGTCDNYVNYTVYTVTVGRSSYWASYDAGQAITWLEPNNTGAYNVILSNSDNSRKASIFKVVPIAGNNIVTLLVTSNNCNNVSNGQSTCVSNGGANNDSGIQIDNSANNGMIQYYYSNSSAPTGGGLRFDVWIPD